MAEYTVIAGPNGAGKSTFSKYLSPVAAIIFDPDHQRGKIEKIYPDIDEGILNNAVIGKYFDLEKKAMESFKSITAETNLRNHFFAQRAGIFKSAGFVTNLVFMLLPDVYASMDRVNLRVAKNGHYVDERSIRNNFELGLINLKVLADKFDRVAIVCAAANYGLILGPELLFAAEGRRQLYLNPSIPDWAIPIINGVSEQLQISARQNESATQHNGRGR